MSGWLAWCDQLKEAARLRAALESIAANTCCDKCQEAAKVAKSALAGEVEERRTTLGTNVET